jgi:hypothetical protein
VQNIDHCHIHVCVFTLYQADDRAGAKRIRPTGHRLSQSAHYPATAGQPFPHSASIHVHCNESCSRLTLEMCCCHSDANLKVVMRYSCISTMKADLP